MTLHLPGNAQTYLPIGIFLGPFHGAIAVPSIVVVVVIVVVDIDAQAARDSTTSDIW